MAPAADTLDFRGNAADRGTYPSATEAFPMMQADTPMPGEDPGTLIEDPSRLDEIEPSPKPSVPEEDDPEVKDTEIQPT